MKRPALPFAISSIPASDLPFVGFDSGEFSRTITSLLESYDRIDAEVAGAPASAFQPVSTRSHVDRDRHTPVRSRELVSA